MPIDEEKVFFQIRIEKTLLQKFRTICGKENINGSAQVRSLIKDWVAQKQARE